MAVWQYGSMAPEMDHSKPINYQNYKHQVPIVQPVPGDEENNACVSRCCPSEASNQSPNTHKSKEISPRAPPPRHTQRTSQVGLLLLWRSNVLEWPVHGTSTVPPYSSTYHLENMSSPLPVDTVQHLHANYGSVVLVQYLYCSTGVLVLVLKTIMYMYVESEDILSIRTSGTGLKGYIMVLLDRL